MGTPTRVHSHGHGGVVDATLDPLTLHAHPEACYACPMHTQWQTVNSIKKAAASKATAGIADLKKDLGQYAAEHGGAFLIYGSAARGDMRFDSDVDILVDFSPSAEAAAWRFAEDACHKHGLVPDVRPKSLCADRFINHISHGALEISGAR